MMASSALYGGHVVHNRLRPRRHRLAYRVFSMLLDLDELPTLDRNLKLFGYNNPAVFSFYDRDHGEGIDGGLKDWVHARLAEAGISIGRGAIRLLCYPRMFGYVFNPLSTYFCYRPDGSLAAILYEVANTFGERHTYIIGAAADTDGSIKQTCAKQFHVSPFMPMACSYSFHIAPPSDAVTLAIHESDAEGLLLTALFHGERLELDDRQLFAMLVRFPLMTLKIMAAIHWEALRLFLKRIPVVRHKTAARPIDATVVTYTPPAE